MSRIASYNACRVKYIAEKLVAWEDLGVERTFLTFWHPFDQLARAAEWIA